MTLRIFHLEDHSDKVKAVKQGYLTCISPKNEAAALGTLERICDRVISGSEAGLARLVAVVARSEEQRSAVKMAKEIWVEERTMSRGIDYRNG